MNVARFFFCPRSLCTSHNSSPDSRIWEIFFFMWRANGAIVPFDSADVIRRQLIFPDDVKWRQRDVFSGVFRRPCSGNAWHFMEFLSDISSNMHVLKIIRAASPRNSQPFDFILKSQTLPDDVKWLSNKSVYVFECFVAFSPPYT